MVYKYMYSGDLPVEPLDYIRGIHFMGVSYPQPLPQSCFWWFFLSVCVSVFVCGDLIFVVCMISLAFSWNRAIAF